MNMYVNEIQISNKQLLVCIVSGPPAVISHFGETTHSVKITNTIVVFNEYD